MHTVSKVLVFFLKFILCQVTVAQNRCFTLLTTRSALAGREGKKRERERASRREIFVLNTKKKTVFCILNIILYYTTTVQHNMS